MRHLTLTVLTLVMVLPTTAMAAPPLTLVDGGQARAQIVVPDEALPVAGYAAQELQYQMRKATGPPQDTTFRPGS